MLMIKSQSIYAPTDTIANEDVNGKQQLGAWRRNAIMTNFKALPKNRERFSRNTQEGHNICSDVNSPGVIPRQNRNLVA